METQWDSIFYFSYLNPQYLTVLGPFKVLLLLNVEDHVNSYSGRSPLKGTGCVLRDLEFLTVPSIILNKYLGS